MDNPLFKLYFYFCTAFCLFGGVLEAYNGPHGAQLQYDYKYGSESIVESDSSITRGIDHDISLALLGHLISELSGQANSSGGKQFIYWNILHVKESYLKFLIYGGFWGNVVSSTCFVKELYLLGCVFLI